MRVLPVLALLAACPLPDDDDEACKDDEGCDTAAGDTGGEETDADVDADTDSDVDTDVDSCEVPEWSICYEYVNYGSTNAWCILIGETYGVGATYFVSPCPGDEVAICELEARTGSDFDHDATAYYYEPMWSESQAWDACESAGGTPG
ncbi:MAG: hypothetical protein ACOZNI_22750 [Myxococcota bacterium]